MGFFEEVNAWLTALLDDYIHQYTAQMAAILEPAVVTLGVLYVLVWGFLHVSGRIEEPVLEGLKRIAILAIVLGVSLNLWLYDAVIVETFYRAPALLAGRLVGANDFVTIVDTILFQGNDVGQAAAREGRRVSRQSQFLLCGHRRLFPDCRDGGLHDVPLDAVACRALGAARDRPADHAVVSVSEHAPTGGGLVRAVGELCLRGGPRRSRLGFHVASDRASPPRRRRPRAAASRSHTPSR